MGRRRRLREVPPRAAALREVPPRVVAIAGGTPCTVHLVEGEARAGAQAQAGGGGSHNNQPMELVRVQGARVRSSGARKCGGGAGDVEGTADGAVYRAAALQKLGYTVSIHSPPVEAANVRGSDYLRERAANDDWAVGRPDPIARVRIGGVRRCGAGGLRHPRVERKPGTGVEGNCIDLS